jgi:hypothetical protein
MTEPNMMHAFMGLLVPPSPAMRFPGPGQLGPVHGMGQLGPAHGMGQLGPAHGMGEPKSE